MFNKKIMYSLLFLIPTNIFACYTRNHIKEIKAMTPKKSEIQKAITKFIYNQKHNTSKKYKHVTLHGNTLTIYNLPSNYALIKLLRDQKFKQEQNYKKNKSTATNNEFKKPFYDTIETIEIEIEDYIPIKPEEEEETSILGNNLPIDPLEWQMPIENPQNLEDPIIFKVRISKTILPKNQPENNIDNKSSTPLVHDITSPNHSGLGSPYLLGPNYNSFKAPSIGKKVAGPLCFAVHIIKSLKNSYTEKEKILEERKKVINFLLKQSKTFTDLEKNYRNQKGKGSITINLQKFAREILNDIKKQEKIKDEGISKTIPYIPITVNNQKLFVEIDSGNFFVSQISKNRVITGRRELTSKEATAVYNLFKEKQKIAHEKFTKLSLEKEWRTYDKAWIYKEEKLCDLLEKTCEKAELQAYSFLAEEYAQKAISAYNKALEKELRETGIITDNEVLNDQIYELDEIEQSFDMLNYDKKENRDKFNETIKVIRSQKQILDKIKIVHENIEKENRSGSDLIDANNFDHEKALKKLKEAAEKDYNKRKISNKEYDLSKIDPKLLKELGLNSKERLSKSGELENEMLLIVIDHAKQIQNTREKYPDKISISDLTGQNIETLKETIKCIKSNDTDQAFNFLEKSWWQASATGDLCIGYTTIKCSRAFAKGAYSGAKRAINIPQRINDIYETSKVLVEFLGCLAEIDMLVETGNIKLAEEKMKEIEDGFSNTFKELKQKFNNATSEEIFFSLGEAFGDTGTTVFMHKSLKRTINFLKPKVKNGLRYTNEIIEDFTNKNYKNPSKSIVSTEGIVIEVEECAETATKGSNINAKKRGKNTSGNKNGTNKPKERIVNTTGKTEFFKSPAGKAYRHHKGEIYVLKDGAKAPCKKAKYITWDYTHNDLEVWNKNGKHLGCWDPLTEKMYKPALPRKLEDL